MNAEIITDIKELVNKFEIEKKYGSIEVLINIQEGTVHNVYFIEKVSRKY